MATNGLKPVIHSGLARAGSFLPASVATFLTSRIVLEHFGVQAFDSLSLMIALISVVPLNDLGVGAAVTATVAETGTASDRTERVLLTSIRVIGVSSLVVAALAVAAGVCGLWPTLLGDASGSNGLIAISLVVFAASFLPGLGQRVLLGVDRNHITVIIQAFFAPLMFVLALVLVVLDVDGSLLVLVPTVAVLVVSLATAVIGFRGSGISWMRLLRRSGRPSRYPGQSIRALSGPMLVITLSAPIAFQSDRLVLSHVSNDVAVANYSIAIQIFGPVTALLLASAWPLWPIWARARAAGEPGPSLSKILAVFAGGATAICAVLVVIADPLGHLIGGGTIDLGWQLPVAAALSIIMQATAYPAAMRLMYPAGIRVVAVCAVLALPLNVGLSIVLAQHLGASGPLFATFAVALLVQTVPILVYNRRHYSGTADALPEPLVGPASTTSPAGAEMLVPVGASEAAPDPSAPRPAPPDRPSPGRPFPRRVPSPPPAVALHHGGQPRPGRHRAPAPTPSSRQLPARRSEPNPD